MKKSIISLLLLVSIGSFAQIPNDFNGGALAYFELSGPVKSVKGNYGKIIYSCTFDSQGVPKTVEDMSLTRKYKEYGQVKHLFGSDEFLESGYTVEYDDNMKLLSVCTNASAGNSDITYYPDGKFKSYCEWCETDFTQYTFIYDDNGDLVMVKSISSWDGAEESDATINPDIAVKIIKKDSHGNWVERQYGDELQTRTIKYFE